MADDKLSALLNTLHVPLPELKKEENFGLKMRIQHVAYMLQFVGEEGFNFSFSTYFRGPYSVDLAKKCSLMTENPEGAIGRSELARWFFDHDLEWLNAAVTIMMLSSSHSGGEREWFEAVRQYRERLSEEDFKSILAELRKRKIIAV